MWPTSMLTFYTIIAVLVNNNTLFVMWGIDPNKAGTSSVLILNTTNPDAITMSNKYIDPNASNATQESDGNTVKPVDGNTSSDTYATKGLSSGATAGIAVAIVVVVRLWTDSQIHIRLTLAMIGYLGRTCYLVLPSQQEKEPTNQKTRARIEKTAASRVLQYHRCGAHGSRLGPN